MGCCWASEGLESGRVGRHWNLPQGDSPQLCTSPQGHGEDLSATHEEHRSVALAHMEPGVTARPHLDSGGLAAKDPEGPLASGHVCGCDVCLESDRSDFFRNCPRVTGDPPEPWVNNGHLIYTDDELCIGVSRSEAPVYPVSGLQRRL